MDHDNQRDETAIEPQTISPSDTRIEPAVSPLLEEHAHTPVATPVVETTAPVSPLATPPTGPAAAANPAQPGAPAPLATPAPGPHGTNGLAVAALVTGIVAFLSGLVPFWGFLVGAAAVILGILGLKRPGGKGMSITGIIGGGLAVLTSLAFTALFVISLASISTADLNEIAGGAAGAELSANEKESAEKIAAKKDFAVGETAHWGDLDVKINTATRNYTPTSSLYKASAGESFVLLNITVTNTDDEPELFSAGKLTVDGTTASFGAGPSPSLYEVDDLDGIPVGGSITGNAVFKVTGATDQLKLEYADYTNDPKTYKFTDLLYTLAF